MGNLVGDSGVEKKNPKKLSTKNSDGESTGVRNGCAEKN
jgi:hypothetical protein